MKTKIILCLLALLIEAALLRLGFWQLARGEEKQQALQVVQRVLSEKRAQPLDAALAQRDGYTWVSARLRFTEQPLLLLDNQRQGSQVGVQVLQVAESASGQALLVDLGWLPLNGQRQLPRPATVLGEVALTGLLLPPASAGLALGAAFTPQADGTWLMMRIDTKALSSALKRPLAARVLRIDPAQRIGFSRHLNVQANALPPEKHRGYALQWFGLAAAFAVLCVGLLFRKKRNG